MPNPNDFNTKNTPNKNKEKEGKEFVSTNEPPSQEGVNVESNYLTDGAKPISVNSGKVTESLAIGNSEPKRNGSDLSTDWSTLKKEESSWGGKKNTTSLGEGNYDTNTNSNDLTGSLGAEPEEYTPPVPTGETPKVKGKLPKEVTEAPKETEDPKTTVENTSPPNDTPPDSEPNNGEAPKEKEEKKTAVSGKLKEVLDVISSNPDGDDNVDVPTDSADEEGAKKVEEARQNIVVKNNLDNNPTENDTHNKNTTSLGGGTTTSTTGDGTSLSGPKTKDKEKEDPNAAALAAFDVTETEEEKAQSTLEDQIKNEAKTQGLMIGRSIGYGAKITPLPDGTFNIEKFSESEDPEEEEKARNKYNHDNEAIAKNMEEFGAEEKPEGGEATSPKKGYYDAYIEGYNEGHREGAALKAEAIAAERAAKMKEEQGTQEYQAGAILGMTCGTLTAQGKTEVDASFFLEENGVYREIPVQTTVAALDDAGFNKKQTPGGELSGPAYEKAFLLHYNMAYREAQNQRTKPPEIDENYKASYEQGYKLGTQKGNGEAGDADLLSLESAFDAKDERNLEKDELQKHRGFYAGYNKGYAEVQEGKKNKVQAEREAKYKKPEFVAGYSTGNLKGFLTAMIEPSGIDLLTALNNPAQMEAAGIPDYFPIPDSLRESIKATLMFGEVAENENESDPTKALLGKPLFKEALLMGYNQGYRQGQNSRLAFKRDKHKMHPDYQRSILVLMPDKEAEYKGLNEEGDSETGFTMGHILANAEFELNELNAKDGRSKEEEKRHADLSKAVETLNGIISKESSFYQLGVNEFSNWWMGVLSKRAKEKKQQFSGPKLEGYNWGMEVGEKVVEGKEKLKELNRKGRDIKARSTQLNAAIKKSENAAKATSKGLGGEDYYLGYRYGYNNAFRVAKEGKKSDMGNLSTGDTLEDAGKLIGADKVHDVIGDLGVGKNVSLQEFKTAITTAKGSFSEETEKAFKDGLSRGYSSGYGVNVVDVKTGENSKDESKTDDKHINDQYKTYQSLKGKDGETQYSDNVALGVLYFFLVGYQYDKIGSEKSKFGLPKGVQDAKSFNLGYKAAKEEAKSNNAVDYSGEAKSKDAYKSGYSAAKYQARYDAFKRGMVRSVVSKNTNVGLDGGNNAKAPSERNQVTDDNESTTNSNVTTGLADLAKDQKIDLNKGKGAEKEEFYLKGNEDAAQLWTKIVYMRKGIHLEDETIASNVTVFILPDNVTLDNKEKLTLDDNTDMGVVNEYYAKKDAWIKVIANYSIEKNYAEKSPKDRDEAAKEKAKKQYIAGYTAKVNSIINNYDEKFMNNWLQDYGYYSGIVENAPDIYISTPNAPYDNMSADEIDFKSPYFVKGYLEGIKIGVQIRNGVIQASEADLANAAGDDYNNGFKQGNEDGTQKGLADAADGLKEPPTRMQLVEYLAEEDKKNNGGKTREESNGVGNYMSYEFKDVYLKTYLTAYWNTRNYEYGRLLGYRRGSEGGDAMYNLEPEEGVRIENEEVFYKGFKEGRRIGVSGLPEDALYQDGKGDTTPKTAASVITKITMEYAERNAAIDVLTELDLDEEIIWEIISSNNVHYTRYKGLNAIKALGIPSGKELENIEFVTYEVQDLIVITDYLEENFDQYLGVSFKNLPSDERASHWNTFQERYAEAYAVAHANSLAEMTSVAMTASLDQREFAESGNGLGASGNAALEVLKELLLGGVQDFYLDDLLLLKMFRTLETQVDNVQYSIEEDLENIEHNKDLADIVSDGEFNEDLEELRRLEKKLEDLENELKNGNLSDGEFMSKQVSITITKAEIKEQKDKIEGKNTTQGQIYHDWQEAEAAAKAKIESIRQLMKTNLSFDTPLESNDDILEYIKINLESSQGNNENVYDDIDIFNDLTLKGSFDYKEANNINASAQGDGYLHLDTYAENIDYDNVSIEIAKNGFEFKAQGLTYIKDDGRLTFWGGSVVTPRIEGGEHAGETYKYHFVDFYVNLGQGVQSQIDEQKYKLKGGPI